MTRVGISHLKTLGGGARESWRGRKPACLVGGQRVLGMRFGFWGNADPALLPQLLVLRSQRRADAEDLLGVL